MKLHFSAVPGTVLRRLSACCYLVALCACGGASDATAPATGAKQNQTAQHSANAAYRLSEHADPLSKALIASDFIFDLSSHVVSALVAMASSDTLETAATQCRRNRLYQVVVADNGNGVFDAGDRARLRFSKCRNVAPSILGTVEVELSQVQQGEALNALLAGVIHFSPRLYAPSLHPDYAAANAHATGSLGFRFVTRGENEGLHLFSPTSAPLALVFNPDDPSRGVEQLAALHIKRRSYWQQQQYWRELELGFEFSHSLYAESLTCRSEGLGKISRASWPTQGQLLCEGKHRLALKGERPSWHHPLRIKADTNQNATLDAEDAITEFEAAAILGPRQALLAADIDNFPQYTRPKQFGEVDISRQTVDFNLQRAVYCAANDRFYYVKQQFLYELDPATFAVTGSIDLKTPLGAFAIADDGSAAWLHAVKSQQIVKVDLARWQKQGRFKIASPPSAVVAMPGHHNLLITFSNNSHRLTAYRDGRALQHSVNIDSGLKPLSFLAVNSQSLVAHLGSSSVKLQRRRLRLDPEQGLFEEFNHNYSAALTGGAFISRSGNILVNSLGEVFDSHSAQPLQKLGGNSDAHNIQLSVADPDSGLIYAVDGSHSNLYSIDPQSGQIRSGHSFDHGPWRDAQQVNVGVATRDYLIYGKAQPSPNAPSTAVYRFDKHALKPNVPSGNCEAFDASPFAKGYEFTVLNCNFVDAVYDSQRDLIYAALSGWSEELSNAIAVIEPQSLTVLNTIPLPYTAKDINLNLDNQVLSVAAQDVPWVSEIDLKRQTLALQTFLGFPPPNKLKSQPLAANLVVSLPGKAAGNFIIQTEQQVLLYRQGKPQAESLANGAYIEFFIDSQYPDILWAYAPGRTTQIKIHAEHLEVLNNYDGLTPGSQLARRDKIIYDSAGTLFNLDSMWTYQTCEIIGHYSQYDAVAAGLHHNSAWLAMNKDHSLSTYHCDTEAERVDTRAHFLLYADRGRGRGRGNKFFQLNDASLLYFDGALSRFAAE